MACAAEEAAVTGARTLRTDLTISVTVAPYKLIRSSTNETET